MTSFNRNSVLVFSSEGQLALSLRKLLPEAIFVPHAECDFAEPQNVVRVLDSIRPHLVINPAAYTQVDQAEKEKSLAQKINADSPREIANWCARNSASMIHFSTDYVYDGGGVEVRDELEAPSPLSHYGFTKLLGDQAIARSGCHHVILRTSWVFSPWGKNFVRTMLKLGGERTSLSIVADQVGAPTYAPDLAAAAFAIAAHPEFKKHEGVFHCTNSGFTSWFGFAEEIFRQARRQGFELKVNQVHPISTSAYPTPAKRPLNSRLSLERLERCFGVRMRPWGIALEECLTQLKK